MIQQDYLWEAGATCLKTLDAGETWNARNLNININIDDFQFIGDSSVNAVGSIYNKKIVSKLIRSTNLGESWDTISNLEGTQLYSVWFFNRDTGIVAASQGVFRTVDGGTTWDTVWSIKLSGYKFGEVSNFHFPTSEMGFAIGYGLSTQYESILWFSFKI